MTTMKVKLTFTEPILGTMPANTEVYADFVGSKAPDAASIEDEIAALGAEVVAEKGMTIFPKLEDGTPYVYDYQLKGFFKGACGFLRKVPGSESSKIRAYKKEIDGLVFPAPRKIPFENFGVIDRCERPLRAQTMQGERVSLACSERIQAGATITFDIQLLFPGHEKAIVEWLDYGTFSGIGQWRNSGVGRFTWERLG